MSVQNDVELLLNHLGATVIKARGSVSEYWGYKWADGSEHYNNCLSSILISHKDFPNIWIQLFEGAQYRNSNVTVVQACEKSLIDDNCEIANGAGALYQKEKLTYKKLQNMDISGRDPWDTFVAVEAFVEKLSTLIFEGDNSINTDKKFITEGFKNWNPDFFLDLARELKSKSFINIQSTINIKNPDINEIEKIKNTLSIAEQNLANPAKIVNLDIGDGYTMLLKTNLTEEELGEAYYDKSLETESLEDKFSLYAKKNSKVCSVFNPLKMSI